MDTCRLPRAKKDADDPTVPASSSRHLIRQESTPMTTLSRLFTAQSSTSPKTSRNSSYTHSSDRRVEEVIRTLSLSKASSLRGHLYIRGLIGGKHSDITVNAFGQQYRLHRIILDQAPFFANALSEPWLDSKQDEITIHPEDVDPSITQSSFDLALRRLYGSADPKEEAHDAIGLFTTGSWLEMDDLVESSVENILRQMTPEALAPLIKLVTSNYYGRAGDRVLASAKLMLCRDGWRMPIRLWDDLPASLVRDIVGGDGFYVDGEWDRWLLAKRIFDRRLKAHAATADLLEPGSLQQIMTPPDLTLLSLVRCNSSYRRNCAESIPDNLQRWASLYTNSNVEPILVLLDGGIHYLHLAFEQLQFIRRARDCIGLPIVPEQIISNALWQQTELRQAIVNANEPDLRLGLAVESDDGQWSPSSRDSELSFISLSEAQESGEGKDPVKPDAPPESATVEPWGDAGIPRKFWIPPYDRNIVLGGNSDPVLGTQGATSAIMYSQESSTPIKAIDKTLLFERGRGAGLFESGGVSNVNGSPPRSGCSYTRFPPFRFSAEFPNARMLKDRKRVYSRTVFYAGSLWNMYIKKIISRRTELGIYLHRAREHETDQVFATTAGRALGSVDRRIGQLEREMLLRSAHQQHRARRTRLPMPILTDAELTADNAGSAGDQSQSPQAPEADETPANNEEASSHSPSIRRILGRSNSHAANTGRVSSTNPTTAVHSAKNPSSPFARPGLTRSTRSRAKNLDLASDSDSETTESDEVDGDEEMIESLKGLYAPTLPAYVDARPTITTYFKIYSPSRGGRMLSVYESAPDKFNFSQSWGWKSSALMVDEGLWVSGPEGGGGGVGGGEESDEQQQQQQQQQQEPGATARENAADVVGGGVGAERKGAAKGLNDGKLRFMVVIGNV